VAPLVECVPNISEGRRREVLDAVADAVRSVEGVRLLDVDADESHNRAVYTFVGEPDAVAEAAFRLTAKAAELIDLNHHKGEHPRMGATDVIPFIPVDGISMVGCTGLAQRLGQRIGRELAIPVFLYGEAATRPSRRNLPDIRKGEFEGLRARIGSDESAAPDCGPPLIHPTAGATAVGARQFLIAYNVNLKTRDLAIAKEIASEVREKDGGLPAVRALGFALADRGLVQVSMNLVDFEKTPPEAAFDAVARAAQARGVEVHGSEIVGLVPMRALPAGAPQRLKLEGFSSAQILEVKIYGAGDPRVAAFVEAIMGGSGRPGGGGRGGSGGESLQPFLSALASGEPTPGGGAASAALGAVGASLAAMACRLTEGKPEFDARRARFREMEAAALALQARLIKAVDEDVEAYGAVLAALRMPKDHDEAKAARSAALQRAFRWATNVPLAVAEACADALELLAELCEVGMESAVSDAGVGAKAARAGFDGASYNVLINLGSIRDGDFVVNARARLDAARKRADAASKRADARVQSALK
jgi:glutamate formiminotransferase/formiminotetrahydrofolate cyclodeaminase